MSSCSQLSPRQQPNPSKMHVLSGVLLFAFVCTFFWQILVSTCQVTRLCGIIDLSSQQVTPYEFRVFRFALPSSLVWVGLSIGSFMIFAGSALMVKLSTSPISSKRLEFVGFYIRKAASSILFGQCVIIFIPSFILFFIVGLKVNWATAGCFCIGALTCTATGHIATAIATRTNTRTNVKLSAERSTGRQDLAFHACLNRTLISSSAVLISTVGLASLSIAATYILYADVQALTGFIGGTTLASLLLRSSSTLSFDAVVTAFNFKPMFLDVAPPNAVTVVSSGVSIITSIASDIYDSFGITTIATAFLASGLPYFSSNQFALCVFNHLNIDQVCGPFGYPESVSFASLICRANNFYMNYPTLEAHTSVSQFVAVPFMLLAASLVVYFIMMFSIHVIGLFRERYVFWTSWSFKRRMALSIVACGLLLIASSALIFYSMFGNSSDFLTSELHGFGKATPRMVLTGTRGQCAVQSAEASTDLLPVGVETRAESYNPTFISGSTHGTADQVAARLFASSLIGIVAGVAVALLSLFTMPSHQDGDTKYLGTQGMILQQFSSAVLLHFPTTSAILLSIILPYRLFGAYAVGLAALGYISSSGASLLGKILGTMLLNAESTEFSVENDPSAGQIRDLILETNRVSSSSVQVVTNGATTLTVITTLFAFIQKSGIWFSPRDLSGTVDVPAPNLIYFASGGQWMVGDVVVSTIVGATAPFLLGALFLTACFRSGLAVYVARRVSGHLSVTNSPSFVSHAVKVSIQECSFLLVAFIMLPLCVGFGFGQRGLSAFIVAMAVVSHLVGVFFCDASTVKKRAAVPRGENNMHKTPKQNVGACIQAAVKTSVSLTLLLCTLMQKDGKNGWVGAVLFAMSLVCVVVGGYLSRRRFIATVEASGLQDEARKRHVVGAKRRVRFDEDVARCEEASGLSELCVTDSAGRVKSRMTLSGSSDGV